MLAFYAAVVIAQILPGLKKSRWRRFQAAEGVLNPANSVLRPNQPMMFAPDLPIRDVPSPGPLLFDSGPVTVRWYGLLIAACRAVGPWCWPHPSAVARQSKCGGDCRSAVPPRSWCSPPYSSSPLLTWRWSGASNQLNWFDALAIWQGGIRHPWGFDRRHPA